MVRSKFQLITIKQGYFNNKIVTIVSTRCFIYPWLFIMTIFILLTFSIFCRGKVTWIDSIEKEESQGSAWVFPTPWERWKTDFDTIVTDAALGERVGYNIPKGKVILDMRGDLKNGSSQSRIPRASYSVQDIN